MNDTYQSVDDAVRFADHFGLDLSSFIERAKSGRSGDEFFVSLRLEPKQRGGAIIKGRYIFAKIVLGENCVVSLPESHDFSFDVAFPPPTYGWTVL